MIASSDRSDIGVENWAIKDGGKNRKNKDDAPSILQIPLPEKNR